MINEIISTVLQILVFALIPFIVYLITRRKIAGFFDYIGLKAPEQKTVWLAAAASLVFLTGGITLVFLSDEMRHVLLNPPSITGKLREMGLSGVSIATLLIIACFKTSLSEEILFRGFIAKRLVARLGFQTGNLVQAAIFASVHLLLFWALSKAGIGFLIFIFFFSGLAGYMVEYINEKVGNGSIIPGWIAHGLGNALSYSILAFAV
ncbi:MAG: CPBP family intramembrane glutamic endopeptidase [Pyrinomonadaceae bacterium]